MDPAKHLIVGIDQRGCGRSRPLITDALDGLAGNTTAALIADIEAVRTRLGIECCLVLGVSWGSTLALAYAQERPDRVTELVLVGVTTTSRDEVDWITEGVGRSSPEAWQRFADASGRRASERVVEAYARRLADTADPDDRIRAAADWDDWESVHVSLDPGWTRRGHIDPISRAVFATLTTHYWAHDGFLTGPDQILRRIDRISHIPAVLIHGRHDISGPVITPWRLHERWLAGSLIVVEHQGHGGPRCMDRMCTAIDEFAIR